MTTCSLLKHMCPTADSVTEMLREDPFKLTGTDFATKMKIGKMRAVWEASQVTNDVEVRHNAERLRQNLPPETTLAELEAVAKLFAKTHWELERVKCPSKGFFERLMLQVQTMFSVIDYSRVTNLTLEDVNQPKSLMTWDPIESKFRNSTQEITIPQPKTCETFRARVRLMAIGYVFMKLKFPEKAQLRTATVSMFDMYFEWLIGKHVWGLAQVDDQDRPVSTPALRHVTAYDRQIRHAAANLMNEGHDIETALNTAKNDKELRSVYFLTPVARDASTPECRACSAPGLAEAHPKLDSQSSKGQPRPVANDDEGGSTYTKAQLRKIRADARAEGEREAKRKLALANGGGGANLSKRQKKKQQALENQARTLALQNGGVGDGSGAAPPPPRAAGARPEKGRGKGKNRDTFEGKPICYNWNRNAACKVMPCTFAHVCVVCHGNHRKCENPACMGGG